VSTTKRLCIIRHAKSSWDDPAMDDFDRVLNDRGNKDAPIMAQRLKERKINFDLILSSPAKRTRQTAKHFCKEIDYDFSKIEWISELYHASPATLLKQIEAVDERYNTIAVIGHNSGLTEFANQLIKDFAIDNIPTCGILCMDLQVDSWKKIKDKNAVFEFFLSPKDKMYIKQSR